MGFQQSFGHSPHLCADVHACLLVDDRAPAEAAQVELGCLDACVREPEGFVACPRPEPVGPETCPPYLACAEAAWPGEGREATVVEGPPDGCGLACAALAKCRGVPVEAALLCAEQCREVLDVDLQREAARCIEHEECPKIEQCVFALPGAQ